MKRGPRRRQLAGLMLLALALAVSWVSRGVSAGNTPQESITDDAAWTR